MELLKEVLTAAISKEPLPPEIRALEARLAALVEQKCYQALEKIKAIIADDGLTDFDCVEQIVCVLEEIGSDGGNRHDF